MQDEDHLIKLRILYTRLSIVFFFLMAFLQGLHSFFFTLFFWPAIGFAVLAFYYRAAAKRVEEETTARWQNADRVPSSFLNSKRLLIFAVGVGVLSFFVIVGSIFSSRKNASTATQETVTSDEPQESVNQSSSYDLALQEYNNQNYRQSISIARKALMNDSNNNDLFIVLGDDYGALKQNDSSYVWFNRAYQNGARSAYLSHWLGYLYDDKGSLSQALEFYKDALKQDSTRSQIYDRLAELEPERAAWYKKKSTQWAQKK